MLRAAFAVLRREIWSGSAQPLATLLAIAVPINFLVLMALFALSGGKQNVALVVQDRGRYAAAMVQALSRADTFALHPAGTPQAGLRLVRSQHDVAMIVIPRAFSAEVAAGGPAKVQLTLDNLNHDFADDTRRGVALAAALFQRTYLPASEPVNWAVHYTYPRTVGFLPFLALSILSAALLLGGLLQGGLGMAREWEAGTIRELMLSPAGALPVLLGKLVATFLLALAGGLIALVGALLLGVPVQGVLGSIGPLLAVLLVFDSIGLALGSLLRSQRLVLPLSFAAGLPLFFLSGPFGPMEWSSPGALAVARVFPIYYASGLLQRSFFGYWPLAVPVGTAIAVLAAWTVASLAAAGLAYRRATAPRGGRW